MTVLYVQDIRRPSSIVAALQLALDMVVTPEKVETILTHEYFIHEYQHVHWHSGHSALGCVSMITGGDRSTVAVFLQVNYGHRLRAANNPPLPEDLLRRLTLEFEAPNWRAAEPLGYDAMNDWYDANLYQIPAAAMRSRSRLQVVLR